MPRNQYLQLFIETNNQIHRPKQKGESGLCNAQSPEHEAGQTDRAVSVGTAQGAGEGRGCTWHLCRAPSPGEMALPCWGTELWSTPRISFGQQHPVQKWGTGVSIAPVLFWEGCSAITYSAYLRFEFVLLGLQDWMHWPCPNYWKRQLKAACCIFH